MRIYHLLQTQWGLESIRKKRMKISRFSDLNDPFELLGANLRDKSNREAFRQWKRQISEIYGLLCFSESWQSPLLWSHYGERHRGLCLGFDVADEDISPVRYIDIRIEVDKNALNEATVNHFLTTKFVEWSYEREMRVLRNLSEIAPCDGKYYAEMDEKLQLKEVIVGALSEVSRDDLSAQIDWAGLDASQIQFTKARLAFKSYAVVRDKRGLR
jgi:hypothetical protein